MTRLAVKRLPPLLAAAPVIPQMQDRSDAQGSITRSRSGNGDTVTHYDVQRRLVGTR
jgi:hypothetical protein